MSESKIPFTPYYQDDSVTIYNADCRQVLPFLQFDLLLSDPPYGVTQQEWDTIDSVFEMIRLAPLSVFTTGERLLAHLINAMPNRYRHIWVWDRVNRNTDFLNASRRPMRSHELIAVFSETPNYQFQPVKWFGGLSGRRRGKGSMGNGSYGQFNLVNNDSEWKHPRSIISVPGNKTNYQVHPTEKPVPLFEYLMQSYPADMTVDPWMGSGTTLVAARQLGRKCVGIEINEEYCELAAKRLQQRSLF